MWAASSSPAERTTTTAGARVMPGIIVPMMPTMVTPP
jgi:hypothetical protein